MKFDITRLPVIEAIVGFLIVALLVTFYFAFESTDAGNGGEPSESVEPTAANGSPPPGETEIVMHDNSFDPGELRVVAGETVTFTITNEGGSTHNVQIAASGDFSSGVCETDGDNPCSDPNAIRGGDTGTLTWDVPDTPGETVDFRCDFHAAEMTGQITIQ